MQPMRRLVLVRHGETDGQSSIRYFGSTDVELSAQGRAQMRALASALAMEPSAIDVVVTSPMKRARDSARILAGRAPVDILDELREIHFGRWEGMTREEIEAMDPILAKDWQAGAEGFEYPGGEARAAFTARVKEGLRRLLALPARGAVVVSHKGVIRTIVKELTGEALPRELPAVGSLVLVTRDGSGRWFLGGRSSNPPGVPTPHGIVLSR
jgi:broad specificity phosphatase PhoE